MKRLIGIAWMVLFVAIFSVDQCSSLYGKPFRSKKSGKTDNFAKEEDSEDVDALGAKDNTPLVGEYTQIVGQNVIVLQGVGLVVGLDGTGEDPPPSIYRETILADMKRRGVPHPAKMLKSPNRCIVVVTAYLPPLVRKNERFDVQVQVPPGSKVKSLNGGHLMECYLSEHMPVPGRGTLEGHQYAKASGPILVSATHASSKDVADGLRRGIIVGGGLSMTERNLDLYLRNDFRSERNSARIASAIGKRFFDYDKYGQQIALAIPKTDQQIELKVLTKYHDNYPRYLNVIRKVAFRETDLARQVRLRRLKWDLLDPETAEQTALQLEAIGDPAVPVLKNGLKSKSAEVRFHSAVALAYLGDASGLDVLVDSARNEYAFRIFALAAMASLPDENPEVHAKLRELLDVDSAETRYGAFRALTTLDPNDPFVRGQKIQDQFTLHVLATNGPPLVHITNCKKTEVVLFGAKQSLRTPLFARAGTSIVVSAAPDSKQVSVCKFQPGRDDQRKTVSTRLEDVILAISELGATFPDVAQFLAETGTQKRLPGRLEIDALPRAGRYYERPSTEATNNAGPPAKTKKQVGKNMAPNLYSLPNGKPIDKKDAEQDSDEDNDASSGGDLASASPTKPIKDKAIIKASATQEVDVKAPNSPATSPDDSAAKSETSAVRQASGVKPALQETQSDSKAKTATNTEQSDETVTPTPPPRRFGFFRFFNFFGNGGVSGNKEP